MATYSDLLRDPRWQKVRLKKLEAAEWMCESCMDDVTMLSVHHKRYVKGRMPWEYDAEELVVLCQPCHEAEHETKDLRAALLARLHVDGPMGIDDFFAFGAGAMPEWMADPVLRSMLEQIRQMKPSQFAAGRFVRNLDAFGIGRGGFERLAALLDTSSLDEAFFSDVLDLLQKHSVPLIGQAAPKE